MVHLRVVRGATETAQQYPQDASQIIAAARTSFLQGDQLLAQYHAQDTARPPGPAPKAGVQ